MDDAKPHSPMPPHLEAKVQQVRDMLAAQKSVLVAFSGGVDSSLLLALAQQALGDKTAAGTVDSPLLPQREKQEAALLTQQLGIKHHIIKAGEMDSREFRANPKNRCYICKGLHTRALMELAKSLGLAKVAHGANTDDYSDYRPGLQAARELGVLSPLADAGLSKQEIREASKALGLKTWDKPSMACLASRIPYGSEVTAEKLAAIEKAEDFLRSQGFKQFRVRHHGEIARIEVNEEDFERILLKPLRQALLRELEGLGFSYISLDLSGYKTGNLNKGIV
ncbi:ExsB family protein [Desulfatibacillum aliphaticivorans]|uniref:ExsB family protein n=1 Tax=Desulfatibacillum aliphaticivorans TaxID=218208 RepID=B8FFA6_DESAL|nr:ATP-dependent sacrificial sulfur transferase LarE [Desulfatibacillum aliphaticivorans]ACL04166.1 ExsB family protein [Desulfatibacillum aliphaticivorans]